MAQFQVKTDLREQQLGEELMIFDSHADRVHVLNGTSAFIWTCLKDGCGVEEIEKRIDESFDTSSTSDVPGLIRRGLDLLQEKGLIEYLAQNNGDNN